ncbi:MAG: hypothetical protein J6T84_09510 [Spirochaetaceae bacterium]|nr:hypothetical protein [Spirochaetaceae bacterium]
MEAESMPEFIKKPEIIVFAGPNGSGKSTITQFAKRSGWAEAFRAMHNNKEDTLEEIPDSRAFEWEW